MALSVVSTQVEVTLAVVAFVVLMEVVPAASRAMGMALTLASNHPLVAV